MANPLADWFEARTGFLAAWADATTPPRSLAGRWRYVSASAFGATLLVEFVTGFFLMTTYSPSSTTAWGSVFYIDRVMDLGWFVRGLHRYATAALVTLSGLHLLLTLLGRAYRSPRETTWWLGVAILLLTMILGVTGNILPWDQRGYWAAQVETTIAGTAPGLGPSVQRLAVGGPELGNLTLTRIYSLHVAALPLALGLAVWGRSRLSRRAERLADGPDPRPANDGSWARNLFPSFLASSLVVGLLAVLTHHWHGFPLDAPANPSGNYPARPEWYFLWLFELRHAFPASLEFLATIVTPTALLVVFLGLPLLDRWLPGRLVHFLACGAVFGTAAVAGALSFQSLFNDNKDGSFQVARNQADRERQRVTQLAETDGVPPDGASYLLARDPLTRGQLVAETKCLSCHILSPHAGAHPKALATTTPQSAPDLAGFGSYRWIRGLLENPQSDTYFGKVPACDGMQTWKEQSKLTPTQLDEVSRFVAAFADIDADTGPADWAARPVVRDHAGRKWFFKKGECADCHSLDGVGSLAVNGTDARSGYMQPAPDLFGWGSVAWTTRMIRKPGARHLYGYLAEEQAMPGFADQLTPEGIFALVRYLKGDYVPPETPEPARANVAAH